MQDNTSLQTLKILYQVAQKKKKKITRLTPQARYPKNIENQYRAKISNWYKPLTDYVKKYVKENANEILRGDNKDLILDNVSGASFKDMINTLDAYIGVYMPSVSELQNGTTNNILFMGVSGIADAIKIFRSAKFASDILQGIGVSFNVNESWWNDVKENWGNRNYDLITSNARNFVKEINELTSRAIVAGWSIKQLERQILQKTQNLTKAKARLLARDQIGKLDCEITQAQFNEINLNMYVWKCGNDERVRGMPGGLYASAIPSHYVMEGKLCRWDNASVYSQDNGKTWIERPSNAVKLHPGQDIQCRCIALPYFPEMLANARGESIDDIDISNVSDVQNTVPDLANAISNAVTRDIDYAEIINKYDFLNDIENEAGANERKLFLENFKKLEKEKQRELSKVFEKLRLKNLNDRKSYFSPTENKIFINFKEKNPPVFSTILHESGHYFDFNFSKFNTTNAKNLFEQFDVYNSLKKDLVDFVNKNCLDKGIKQITDVSQITRSNRIKKNFMQLFFTEDIETSNKRPSEIRDKTFNYASSDVQDLVGGILGTNKIKYKQKGGWNEYVFIYGHRESYWNSGREFFVAKESIAEMFDTRMYDDGRRETFKRFFPETYKQFDDIVTQVLK